MFSIIFLLIIIQRLVELIIAKRNEQWMIKKGAIEYGAQHYPWMIMLHISFSICLLLEVQLLGRSLSAIWIIWLTLFLLTQLLRIWCLASLGRFWNTKIFVLPNVSVTKKGPYRWIRHPNYVVVTIEILVIPLLFNAYMTAALFTILNLIILSIRIPIEETALKKHTNYHKVFD